MSAEQNTGGGPFAGAGPLFVVGFDGTEPSSEIRELIGTFRIGGVILYGKNCLDALQVRALTTELRHEAREAGYRQPLLIAIDQEQGRVVRIREGVTLFPSAAELALLDDPGLVSKVSCAISRELLSLGVNWNLAPVADVFSCPSSTIGNRSFGTAPEAVAVMVESWVRGAEAAGLAGCLKHFPGHGGTERDSHVSLPVVNRDRDGLEAIDLVPFRRGISAGAPAVMTVHVTFPSLDGRRPATFSPPIIRGLLRREIGFHGVVVSDDLEMAGAFRRYSLLDGAVAALEAGVDLLIVSGMLLPSRDLPALVEELSRAIASGEVSGDDCGAALSRIEQMKARYLAGDRAGGAPPPESVLRCPEHLALQSEVLDRLSRKGGA